MHKSLIPFRMPLLVVGLFAILGLSFLFSTRAAGPLVAVEPEAGTKTAPATAVTDQTASGTQYIKFGSAVIPPTPPTTPGTVVPTGISGNWKIAFQDEFDGTSINTSKWFVHNGKTMNEVTTSPSNVSVANGEAMLQRSSASSGAMITSSTVDGVGKAGGFELPRGGVVEARIFFPSNGSKLYNWSAFWTNADPWACGGEHDIAEQLDGGDLTINYHYGCYPNVTHANQRPNPPGHWGNAWHTFALHRKTATADVYWDGKLMKSYATPDNGDGESIILNAGGGSPQMLGAAGAMRIDYVRAWTPQ